MYINISVVELVESKKKSNELTDMKKIFYFQKINLIVLKFSILDVF